MPSSCAPIDGRRARVRVLAPFALVALSACSVQGLAFREDDRLQIVSPEERAEVEVPFDLDWTFDGALDPDGAAAFGVLIDWTPPPPGKSLESLLDDDPACGGPTGCPDGYLERNRIYVTTDTQLIVDNVPIDTARDRRGFHEATVVLVDAEGRRVGETSAFVRFRTPSKDR